MGSHLQALEGAAKKRSRPTAATSPVTEIPLRPPGRGRGIAASPAPPTPTSAPGWPKERARGPLPPAPLPRPFRREILHRMGRRPHGTDATTVLSARGPKFRRKLPRPLSEDGAREILTEIGADPAKTGSPPATPPSPRCFTALACGSARRCRLTGADHPLPPTLRINGKGGKTRPVRSSRRGGAGR